jgi:hypothetical protein
VSIILESGKVDGNALVGDLLAALGLTDVRVTWIRIEPEQVTVEYLLENEFGNPYMSNDAVAAGVVVLPIEWRRK